MAVNATDASARIAAMVAIVRRAINEEGCCISVALGRMITMRLNLS
jgi:hypothetical protein